MEPMIRSAYEHQLVSIASPTFVPAYSSRKFILRPTTMKASASLLKAVRVKVPVSPLSPFVPPALSTISASELPNNAFETEHLYKVKKTAFGHWPVYKKVQNTRISTEIKRIEGNARLFSQELLAELKLNNLRKGDLKVNELTGEVNIKGDHVEKIKAALDRSA